MINLYEFECTKCDAIIQIQLSDYLRKGMVCVCEAEMQLNFHTEIDEALMGQEIEDYNFNEEQTIK